MPSSELDELRGRLAEAEQTLRAIRAGEVDAVVVTRDRRPRVFTLEGADHAYRVLIESMNEGALTLAADTMILYANHCFAGMVRRPLEQVMGGSFCRFLSAEDRAKLRPLLTRSAHAGSKIQVVLQAGDGSHLPAQLSIRRLGSNGTHGATTGVVVTDLTAARRNEERLRALAHRVVQVQETERGRVALELHDHITQRLCGLLFSSQALAHKLLARGEPLRREAAQLCAALGQTAAAVERISQELRPSVLDQLGLVAAMTATSAEFTDRTAVPVRLDRVRLDVMLPGETELALYRILQEALRNVEEHARARHVTVSLRLHGAFVHLTIKDDGVGFAPNQLPARRKAKEGLGVLSMRERATYVGGTLTVNSAPRAGTIIVTRVPVPAGARRRGLAAPVRDSPGKRARLAQSSARTRGELP